MFCFHLFGGKAEVKYAVYLCWRTRMQPPSSLTTDSSLTKDALKGTFSSPMHKSHSMPATAVVCDFARQDIS